MIINIWHKGIFYNKQFEQNETITPLHSAHAAKYNRNKDVSLPTSDSNVQKKLLAMLNFAPAETNRRLSKEHSQEAAVANQWQSPSIKVV